MTFGAKAHDLRHSSKNAGKFKLVYLSIFLKLGSEWIKGGSWFKYIKSTLKSTIVGNTVYENHQTCLTIEFLRQKWPRFKYNAGNSKNETLWKWFSNTVHIIDHISHAAVLQCYFLFNFFDMVWLLVKDWFYRLWLYYIWQSASVSPIQEEET